MGFGFARLRSGAERSEADAMSAGADRVNIAPLTMGRIDEVIAIEGLSFSDPWTRGMFLSELEIGGGTYARFAERGGMLVGYLLAVLIEGEADLKGEAHLGNLAVHPSARRAGVGQRLLDDLLRTAVKRQIARVTLEVRESNQVARNFYYRNDFIDIAIRKNYYRNPIEDAIVMLRGLGEGSSA